MEPLEYMATIEKFCLILSFLVSPLFLWGLPYINTCIHIYIQIYKFKIYVLYRISGKYELIWFLEALLNNLRSFVPLLFYSIYIDQASEGGKQLNSHIKMQYFQTVTMTTMVRSQYRCSKWHSHVGCLKAIEQKGSHGCYCVYWKECLFFPMAS